MTRAPAPPTWVSRPGYEDIRYETSEEGIAKITIARPEVRNAFRPQTVMELQRDLPRYQGAARAIHNRAIFEIPDILEKICP